MPANRQPARTFRDLAVWRKAHEFVLAVYTFTTIPANIVEGFRRRGKADKARFMNVADGSVEECRYFLILANDLGYGDISSLSGLLDEVSRMLNAYASAILASDS